MIGNILVILGFLFSVLSSVLYFKAYKNNSNNLALPRIFFHSMVTAVILASVYLLYLILNHQFQYNYVYAYSSRELSLGLLISTFYAGQEGSFLLWALFVAIIGVFVQQSFANKGDLEPRVMAVYCLVQAFMLLMISPLVKNPFEFLWSGEAAIIPLMKINPKYLTQELLGSAIVFDQASNQQFLKLDSALAALLESKGVVLSELIANGRGLNPLLQNFWMQIHPPVLFIGFAAATVPFALTIAALMKDSYEDWLKYSLPWTLFVSLVLGAGIMLGGYWAYGVLGWGGYWGWDPVENSSLIPWILAVASVHTLLIQRKSFYDDGTHPYIKTNMVLSILVFILVIYSTFLTRSGILGEASVHSFVDPGFIAYVLLLAFLLLFLLGSVVLLALRWKSLSLQTKRETHLLSRDMALFASAVVLLASAIIIFVGTSAPIIGKSIEISFYNNMNLPLAILMGILNGLSLALKWKETEGKNILERTKIPLALTIIATIVTLFIGVTDFGMLLFALSSYFTIFMNFDIAIRVVKGNYKKTGAYISHIGIGIFFLGVLASSKYDQTTELVLERNKPQKAFGYDVTFTGFNVDKEEKYYFNVKLSKDGYQEEVKPVMFWSEMNNGVMKNPDILQRLIDDIYISPLGYDDGTQAESGGGVPLQLKKGEPTKFENAEFVFTGFEIDKDAMTKMTSGMSFSVGAKMEIKVNNKVYSVVPKLEMSQEHRQTNPVKIDELGWVLSLENISVNDGVAIVNVTTPNNAAQTPSGMNKKETLSISISKKPFVSFVWIGTFLTLFGFVVSLFRRSSEIKLLNNESKD